MDTGNLTSPHCTTKDKYMATLLLNGAGRFGSNGLYQISESLWPELLFCVSSLLQAIESLCMCCFFSNL
jgi:hypothetical protein